MSRETNPASRYDVESFDWHSSSREAADGGVQVARISQDIARSLFAGDQTIIGALDDKPEDDVILVRQGPSSHSGVSDPHAYTTTEWKAFMQGVNHGEFDRLTLRNDS